MSTINTTLAKRFNKGGAPSKAAALAKQTAEGSLSSFTGIFAQVELNDHEKTLLENILNSHTLDSTYLTQEKDLSLLIEITSEIKAIHHQAALLHGERIKKAQTILKNYQEGAFSQWLIATYGNRQTPYNFLLYYEFYETLPKKIRELIELMPRQAIYTLASRKATLDEKMHFIEGCKGQTKNEILKEIRERFPLNEKDKRKEDLGEIAIQSLQKAISLLINLRCKPTVSQKNTLKDLLETLQEIIQKRS